LQMHVKQDQNGTGASDEGQGSSADQAYNAIRHMIVIGALSASELLSESDLCRRTGGTRTPVREALLRLRHEGFIDVLPRRGFMVTPVDVLRQLELIEARRPLEELMVTLASKRATDAQRQRMLCLADEIEHSIVVDDRERFSTINQAIHLIEAEAAQNRYLLRQMDMIHSLSRRFWYSIITDSGTWAMAAEHHGNTLRAIVADDAESARAHCSRLLDLLEVVSQKAIDEKLRSLLRREDNLRGTS
jgi:DNA-binding GntR family transcriptional regulator